MACLRLSSAFSFGRLDVLKSGICQARYLSWYFSWWLSWRLCRRHIAEFGNEDQKRCPSGTGNNSDGRVGQRSATHQRSGEWTMHWQMALRLSALRLID